MTQKQSLRKQLISVLAALPETARSAKSRSIAHMLFAESTWKKADAVFIYLSYGFEVETGEMVLRAFSENKIVAAPRITGNEIVFHRISAPDKNLEHSRIGIREPIPSLPVILPEQGKAPLVITPGLAFDREKNRLGKGKGYYDRFFSSIKNPDCIKIGICFHEQLAASVPAGENDRKVDIIITDSIIIK